MAQIKIKVKDILGKELVESSVVFNLEHRGLIERLTDENGLASISGIEVGVTPVTITKEKYITQSFVVKVENEEQIIEKEIVMILNKNEETPKEAVKEVEKVVENIVNDNIIQPFIFSEPKTFEEAKSVYKELENNIKNQKENITKAFKDGVHDVVQQQASNLTYTLGQQLTASIHWYVEQRSKLNPLGSLKDLAKWSSMTAMIGGLFIIRSNLVDFLNKVLEKLEKGI